MTIVDAGRSRVALDDLERQLAHWSAAAHTFLDAEEFASSTAWKALESDVGLPLRAHLNKLVSELLQTAGLAREMLHAARRDPAALDGAARAIQNLRRTYIQVETTLEFFGDAVRTRTSSQLGAVLGALDQLAVDSMTPVLRASGHQVPPVLTYVDKGMGASILRAGIRLWTPGSVNPVAAIKIVRHNLYRPTSLFHESGHQVASFIGWVPVLGAALQRLLGDDESLPTMWSGWASEIAADVFAFVHTGFASVSALYDVVGDDRTIFRWPLGDPHPIGWLRTLLGCAMCRVAFGAGPWDVLEASVIELHRIGRADPALVPALTRSLARLADIATVCLETPIPGLNGRAITHVLPPARVSPTALSELERQAGPALWTSSHWRTQEGIRIVALAGLREAERPQSSVEWAERAQNWFTSRPAAV